MADRPTYVVSFEVPVGLEVPMVLEGLLRRHGFPVEASLSADGCTMTMHVEDDDLRTIAQISDWIDARGWRSRHGAQATQNTAPNNPLP